MFGLGTVRRRVVSAPLPRRNNRIRNARRVRSAPAARNTRARNNNQVVQLAKSALRHVELATDAYMSLEAAAQRVRNEEASAPNWNFSSVRGHVPNRRTGARVQGARMARNRALAEFRSQVRAALVRTNAVHAHLQRMLV